MAAKTWDNPYGYDPGYYLDRYNQMDEESKAIARRANGFSDVAPGAASQPSGSPSLGGATGGDALTRARAAIDSGEGVPLADWNLLSTSQQQELAALPGFRREGGQGTPTQPTGPTDQEIFDRIMADIQKNPTGFTGTNFMNYENPWAAQYGKGLNGLPKGAQDKINAYLGSQAFTDLVTGAGKAGTPAPSGPAPGTALGDGSTYLGSAPAATPAVPEYKLADTEKPFSSPTDPTRPVVAPDAPKPPVLGAPSKGPADILGSSAGAGIGWGQAGGTAPKTELPPVSAPTGEMPSLGSAAPRTPAKFEDPALTAAREAALKRLNEPSVWSPEKLQEQIDYYTKAYQQGMEKQGQAINAKMLGEGLWYSGARGEAQGLNLSQFNKDVAQNVVVPLTTEAMKQNEAAKQAAIDNAARIGTEGYQEWLSTQNLNQSQEAQALKQRLDMAAVTGQLNIPSVKASELGIDTTGWKNPDGTANTEKWNALVDQIRARGKDVLGRDLTVAEIQTLGAGGTLQDVYVPSLEQRRFGLEESTVTGTYKGGDTMAAKQAFGFDREITNPDGSKSTQHVYGSQEIQQALQASDQNFQKVMAAGFSYTDPTTGEVRRVLGTDERITTEWQRNELTRAGYDQVVTGADGKPILGKDGKPIMKHIEGTQEASTKLANRELELKQQGLSQEDAHFKAQQEWLKQQYSGFYKARKNPDGTPALDEKGQPIVDWVNGTAGIEEARNQLQRDLQANGIAADVAKDLADKDYQDKVRGGYKSIGEDGKEVWIRGTQSDAEYMLTLQQQFQTSEAAAARLWTEQQRTGYTKIEEYTKPDGTKGTREVRVKGTEDFASTQARLDRDLTLARDKNAEILTRAGWDKDKAERALDRAQALLMQKNEFGEARNRLAAEQGLVREGWAVEDARQAVQLAHDEEQARLTRELTKEGWTRQEAEQALNRSQELVVLQRTQNFQRELADQQWSETKLAAAAEAAERWKINQANLTSAEGIAGAERKLREDLTKLGIEAEKDITAVKNAWASNESQLARDHEAQQAERDRNFKRELADQGYTEAKQAAALLAKERATAAFEGREHDKTMANYQAELQKQLQQAGFTHDEVIRAINSAEALDRQEAELAYNKSRDDLQDKLTRDGWDKEDARHLADRLSREALTRDEFTVRERMQQSDIDSRESMQGNEIRSREKIEADRIAAEQNAEWGYYRTVENPDGTSKTEWVPGRQAHQTSLQQMQVDLTKAGWAAQDARDQAQYIRSIATDNSNFLASQFIDNATYRYMNGTPPMLRADAAKKAAEDWKAVSTSFGDGTTLQERLEKMQLEVTKRGQDISSDNANDAMLAQAVSGLTAPLGKKLLDYLFPASGQMPAVTPEALGGMGISMKKDVDNVMAWFRAKGNGGEGLAEAGLGAAPAVSSGVGGAAGAAPATGIKALATNPATLPVIAAAAGIYVGVKALRNTQKEQATFDQWWENDTAPSDRAAIRGYLESEGVPWSDRGNVYEAMKDLAAKKAAGEDISKAGDGGSTQAAKVTRRARDMVYVMEDLNAKNVVRAANAITKLADAGLMSQDTVNIDTMTRSQRAEAEKAWEYLPADAKTASSASDTAGVITDLRNYGAATGARNTKSMVDDIVALRTATEGKTADDLTLGQERTLRELWVLRGGDPRVPIEVQFSRLSVPPSVDVTGKLPAGTGLGGAAPPEVAKTSDPRNRGLNGEWGVDAVTTYSKQWTDQNVKPYLKVDIRTNR